MKFLKGIPKCLYKYRVWHSFHDTQQFGQRLLTHNEVFLASAEKFNDPFDGALPFRYKEADMTPENIFLKLRGMLLQKNPNITETELQTLCWERQSSGVFEDGRYWKENYQSFIDTVKATFGILSLAKSKKDILMWSHYANSHTGYCVGLDSHMLYNEIGGQIGKVIYSNQFPEMDLFDESPIALLQLTNTKSKKWSYENEYRIVKPEGANLVVKLPNEAVLEIVLGCNMPEKDKEEIYKLANIKFPNARLFETQINLFSFKLDLIPILNRVTL